MRFIHSSFVGLALLVLAYSPRFVIACDCDFNPPDPAGLDAAPGFDALFLGELSGQQSDFEPSQGYSSNTLRWLKFKVVRSWKGVTGTEVVVLTEAGGSFAGCGFWGTKGVAALIYARALPTTGELAIPICSWQPESYGAEEHIQKLDELGIVEIPLTEGLDNNFTAIQIRPRLCGIGIFQPLILTITGLFMLQLCKRN